MKVCFPSRNLILLKHFFANFQKFLIIFLLLKNIILENQIQMKT